MKYNEVPPVLKELWVLNLKTTVEDRSGEAIILVEKDENLDEKALKAIRLIAKQKEYNVVNFPKHKGLY